MALILPSNARKATRISQNAELFLSRSRSCSYMLCIRSNSLHMFMTPSFFLSPDTEAERNALKEHVYPKLRDFCRENYGIEFQVTGCVPAFSTFIIPLISFFLSFPPPARGADNFQSSSLPALTAKCLQIYIGAYTAISAWRALGAACRGPCPFKRTEGQQR